VLIVAERISYEKATATRQRRPQKIGTQMHADAHRLCERAIRLWRTASHSARDEDGVVAVVEG
jgi:hypothetical protein